MPLHSGISGAATGALWTGGAAELGGVPTCVCWEVPMGNATLLFNNLDFGGGVEGSKLNMGGSFQPGVAENTQLKLTKKYIVSFYHFTFLFISHRN